MKPSTQFFYTYWNFCPTTKYSCRHLANILLFVDSQKFAKQSAWSLWSLAEYDSNRSTWHTNYYWKVENYRAAKSVQLRRINSTAHNTMIGLLFIFRDPLTRRLKASECTQNLQVTRSFLLTSGRKQVFWDPFFRLFFVIVDLACSVMLFCRSFCFAFLVRQNAEVFKIERWKRAMAV